MATRIQLSRGTAARWTTVNPILAQGELGLETDTGRMKMGDGTTAWSSLAYFAAGAMLASNNLSELASPSAARTNLGLGGLAVLSAVAINLITATGTPGATNVLRGDGAWAGVDTTMFAANVIDTDATLAAASNTRIATQAAVKSYIDNALTGLFWKAAVDVATTANITLSGEQTIDGVLTSGSRVLVKNQSTASQNGIYVSGAGAWSRATDADAGAELVSAAVFVKQGTVNGDTQWTCTNNSITLGSTSIAFAQVSGAGTYSAGTGLQLSGNQFSIDSTVATLAGSQTLTNKTLTSAVLDSPTMTTPTLGVAAGTSLALGGATIGSNALAVTGTANISGATTVGSLVSGNAAIGNNSFAVSTTGNIIIWNNGLFGFSSSGTVNSGSSIDTIMTRKSAASWQLGAADAAAPVAQTLGVQSVVAGTSNTAGVDFTIKGSTSTGSGTPGAILFQVGGSGAAATAQNTYITPWKIAGGTGHFLAGTDNTYDIGASGASRPRHIYVAGNARVGTTAAILWESRVHMYARGSGQLALYNSAENDFDRLQFGGTTSSFPSLKRSSATLQARLADDSAFASIQGKLTTDTAYTAGSAGAATGYITIYDSTGTAYKIEARV